MSTNQKRDRRKEELHQEIDIVERRLRYLMKELKEIKDQERDEEARSFISKTDLTLDMIHDPDAKDSDLPWFGHISKWADYIRELPSDKQRPYAAWNGLIYRTNHLINGGFEHLPNVRMSDLKETKD